jgi:hypothetical protein
MSGKILASKAIQAVRTYQNKDGKEERKYSTVGWLREKSEGDIQFYVDLNHQPDVTFVVFRESKNAQDEDGGQRAPKSVPF